MGHAACVFQMKQGGSEQATLRCSVPWRYFTTRALFGTFLFCSFLACLKDWTPAWPEHSLQHCEDVHWGWMI